MRYELKYVISPIQYMLLKSRLKPFVPPDEHAGEDGDYFIRSIYFDSGNYDALSEKTEGVLNRRKYRLRFYNGDSQSCSLECKAKASTRIEKTAVPVTQKEVECLLKAEGNLEACQPESLLGELQILIRNKDFKPVVVVDYLREAYVHPLSNLRITFDKEVAAGTVKDCLTKQRCISNVLPEGQMVLEVKYDRYIPEHISHVLSSIRPVQTAVSKYVMCVTQNLGGRIL